MAVALIAYLFSVKCQAGFNLVLSVRTRWRWREVTEGKKESVHLLNVLMPCGES